MVEKIVEKDVPTITVTDEALENGGLRTLREELRKHRHLFILYHGSIERARKLSDEIWKFLPSPSRLGFPYNHVPANTIQEFRIDAERYSGEQK